MDSRILHCFHVYFVKMLVQRYKKYFVEVLLQVIFF